MLLFLKRRSHPIQSFHVSETPIVHRHACLVITSTSWSKCSENPAKPQVITLLFHSITRKHILCHRHLNKNYTTTLFHLQRQTPFQIINLPDESDMHLLIIKIDAKNN